MSASTNAGIVGIGLGLASTTSIMGFASFACCGSDELMNWCGSVGAVNGSHDVRVGGIIGLYGRCGVNQRDNRLLKFREFLVSQIEGAQAQIDDHESFRERGLVGEGHLNRWKAARYSFDEALRTFDSLFEMGDWEE